MAGFAAIESVTSTPGALAEDVSYLENMPMDPIVGREMTGVVLHSYLDLSTEVERRIVRRGPRRDVVINEISTGSTSATAGVGAPAAGFWRSATG